MVAIRLASALLLAQLPAQAPLCNNLRQVSHTVLHLSTGSLIPQWKLRFMVSNELIGCVIDLMIMLFFSK